MGEDINGKIQQMAELLGQENMPDNVKNLLTMLADSLGEKKEESNSASDSHANNEPEPGSPGSSDSGQQAQPFQTGEITSESRSDTGKGNTGQSVNFNRDMNPDDLTARLKKAISNMGNINDPRINLLLALKPFLNSHRQKKIGNCIQLLQFTGLARLLNNQDK